MNHINNLRPNEVAFVKAAAFAVKWGFFIFMGWMVITGTMEGTAKNCIKDPAWCEEVAK